MKIETEIDDRQVDIIGDYLKGRKITIGVSGGIAAIEMPKLARQLRRYGANVRAIMTSAAEKIINPIAMHWGTGSDVVTELGGKAEHIQLEDLIVVAPATLNTINKIANGIADNSLTTAVASAMGRGIPILIAPAMHYSLFLNPFFQENLAKLRDKGVKFVPPRIGEGKVKIAKNQDIATLITRELAAGPLKNKNILINAGPTRGLIDAVRYISNRSSGQLGIAIANDLYLRGANVKLVYGPGTAIPPNYLDIARVSTPNQMLEEMVKELTEKEYDAAIFTAAVLDYVPEKFMDEKLKSGKELTVKLVPTPKIIKEIDRVGKRLFKVGFKLEYNKSKEELIDIAYKALLDNRANLVVANDLSKINGKEHPAYIITPEKGVIDVPNKNHIVSTLADVLGQRLNVTYYKTIFDSDEMHDQNYQTMKDIGEKLDQMGIIPKYSTGTYGNCSIREDTGFVITARKIDKSALKPEDLVYVSSVDDAKKEKHVSGIKKPSSEVLVHQKIYEKFPETNTIIHAHDDIAVKHAEKLGIPVTDIAYPCGTLEGALECLAAAEKSSYIVMKNHGVLARGKSAEHAMAIIQRYHQMAESFEQKPAPEAEQEDCYYMKYLKEAEK